MDKGLLLTCRNALSHAGSPPRIALVDAHMSGEFPRLVAARRALGPRLCERPYRHAELPVRP